MLTVIISRCDGFFSHLSGFTVDAEFTDTLVIFLIASEQQSGFVRGRQHWKIVTQKSKTFWNSRARSARKYQYTYIQATSCNFAFLRSVFTISQHFLLMTPRPQKLNGD